jgi:hypothetical protein
VTSEGPKRRRLRHPAGIPTSNSAERANRFHRPGLGSSLLRGGGHTHSYLQCGQIVHSLSSVAVVRTVPPQEGTERIRSATSRSWLIPFEIDDGRRRAPSRCVAGGGQSTSDALSLTFRRWGTAPASPRSRPTASRIAASSCRRCSKRSASASRRWTRAPRFAWCGRGDEKGLMRVVQQPPRSRSTTSTGSAGPGR